MKGVVGAAVETQPWLHDKTKNPFLEGQRSQQRHQGGDLVYFQKSKIEHMSTQLVRS